MGNDAWLEWHTSRWLTPPPAENPNHDPSTGTLLRCVGEGVRRKGGGGRERVRGGGEVICFLYHGNKKALCRFLRLFLSSLYVGYLFFCLFVYFPSSGGLFSFPFFFLFFIYFFFVTFKCLPLALFQCLFTCFLSSVSSFFSFCLFFLLFSDGFLFIFLSGTFLLFPQRLNSCLSSICLFMCVCVCYFHSLLHRCRFFSYISFCISFSSPIRMYRYNLT